MQNLLENSLRENSTFTSIILWRDYQTCISNALGVILSLSVSPWSIILNNIILLLVALTAPLVAAGKLGFDDAVVGQVKTICNAGGCWADLMASDGKSLRLRLEVKDGSIVIPVSALNRTIDTTGQFISALKLTREQATSCLEHLVRDPGKANSN
jgi:hypothetical protein